MATASAPKEQDEQSETKNIVRCLQFLANESENAELSLVSKLIRDAIARIVNVDTHQQQHAIDGDFAESACAFKAFLKFYLVGNHTAREELIELIRNIDKGRLEAYVH